MMKLEAMGSVLKDDQLVIYMLNNLTIDYALQMILLEKGIESKNNLLAMCDKV
jgi:hypothetical protein